MSPRKSRFVALIILGGPVAIFGLSGLRAVQLARQGDVPAGWRDLDCDGHVSPAEWLRGGIDFRLRPSQLVAGCQDIYAVKSGAPVVVRCTEPPVCRIARDLLK
ncbi:MAG: hypothetical protein ABR567_08715 [Myxococcales bacterium]|nr:hypothetical protein [Myxococcales bacterium]